MPRVDYQDILNALPFLDRSQLEQVKKRVNLNIQGKTGRTVNSLEGEDWLLEGIKAELKRRGIDQTPLPFVLKNNTAFKGFNTKSARVRELLEKAAPGLSLVERRYLGEVSVKELARYIETWQPKAGQDKVAVSLYSLLHHVDRIPEALNNSFPGYIEAQMLGIIITHQFT